MTLFEHLCDDGRHYRYVGAIWGSNSEVHPGTFFATIAQGQVYRLVDSPDKYGWYIHRNGDIAYRGVALQETVLELVEEGNRTTTPDPREQLKAQVEALANTAQEVWPAVAKVLLTLLGAMTNDRAYELSLHTSQFSEAEMKRIQALNKGNPHS